MIVINIYLYIQWVFSIQQFLEEFVLRRRVSFSMIDNHYTNKVSLHSLLTFGSNFNKNSI